MSYTPAQAREHIYATYWATFNDPDKGWRNLLDWEGNPLEPLAEQPDVEWDNDIGDDTPEVEKPTIYAYVRHYASTPATVGGESRKRTTRKGFVMLRVWVPRDTGLKTADALSYVAKTAFERKRGVGAGSGIIFRSWRPVEAGNQKTGPFLIVSTVDFEYDESTGA